MKTTKMVMKAYAVELAYDKILVALELVKQQLETANTDSRLPEVYQRLEEALKLLKIIERI
jgi:hypothetical protein